jgi:hypothetical protein
LLTYMGFLYEDLSAINTIGEHQTRWAFNHRWASNPVGIQPSMSIKPVSI